MENSNDKEMFDTKMKKIKDIEEHISTDNNYKSTIATKSSSKNKYLYNTVQNSKKIIPLSPISTKTQFKGFFNKKFNLSVYKDTRHKAFLQSHSKEKIIKPHQLRGNGIPNDIIERINLLKKLFNSEKFKQYYEKRPNNRYTTFEIITEYIKLEQIHTVEEIPVQGVFINPSSGNIARADKENSIPIKFPSKDNISQAISVWEDLEDVYPGDNKKLAHIIRWGIVSPFSYILKTNYTWYPMLFLYGASRTSKTTLAEISLSPYTTIDDEISIGGGSFDTPYRIGKALSRQGIGTIINEPGNTISSELNIEVIKRAVESPYSREKQLDGVHTKIPAYSNMCFTSNSFIPTNDAFVRRCDYLEFTKKERLDDDDIDDFEDKFNHQSWHNTRFIDLRPIGDFMVSYVNEHQEILGYKRKELEFGLLDALFKYVGESTPKWLKSTAELLDVSDTDNEILSEFRRMFMKDYKALTRNSNKIHELAAEVSVSVEFENGQMKVVEDDSSGEDFRKLVKAVIISNNIDYIYWHNDGVIINTAVKNALKEFCGIQVTCKGLADYMDKKDTVFKYKGNSVRGFKLSFDEFISFLNGGEVTKNKG